MGEALLPSRTVDENTLNQGFVVLTGGEDRFGRPILTFPVSEILSTVKQTTPASLALNLQYFLQLLPIDKKAFGVSILVNFFTATKDFITLVCEALESLQTESPKAISTLYAIQPKSKDLQKSLKKLLGLKASKKNPKIPIYESVLLQDKTGLTQFIASTQLTEDYGGTLSYNHKAWIVFKRKLEDLEKDVRIVHTKVPEISDKVNMLLEYDIPASIEDSQTLLNTVQRKYNDLMKELNIETVIDDLGTFQDKIDNPTEHMTFGQIIFTVTFKDAKVKVQGHRTKLVKIRKDLSAVYRQAEERISMASKVGKYKVKAEKVIRWLSEIGFPTVNQDPEIADCLSQAEILKNHFYTGFYSIAKDVLTVSEKIVKKLDDLIKEVKGHGVTEIVAYRKNYVTTINRFKDMVEKKKQVYENVYNFFFNAVLAVRWYHKALTFLPIQLLQQPSIPNTDKNASVYVSAALRVAMENFLLRHPAPSNNHLNKIKNLLPAVKDSTVKNQARLTVQRVSDLKRLMSNPETLTVQSLKDIIFWKQQLAAGRDDLHSGHNDAPPVLNADDTILTCAPHVSVPDLSRDPDLSRIRPLPLSQDTFDGPVRRPASSMMHGYRPQSQASQIQPHVEFRKELPRDLSYVTWRKQKLLKSSPPRHHQSFSQGTSPYSQNQFRNSPLRSESQRHSPRLMSQSTLEINRGKDMDADRLGARTPKLRFVGVDDSSESVLDSRVQSPVHGVRFRTRSMNALNQKDSVMKTFEIEGESDYPSVREQYVTNAPKRNVFPSQMSRSFDDKERYVTLSYAKPEANNLPNSLQHIDVQALRDNVPQYHEIYSRGIPFRDLQRPLQNVPSVKITDTSLAKSMPDLARPLSIEAISNSELSVEEKLNLMSMLCESDETEGSVPVRPESAFDAEYRTRRPHSRLKLIRPSRPASAGPRAFDKTYRNAQLPLTYHRKSFDDNATQNTLNQGKPVGRSKSGAGQWFHSLPHPRRLEVMQQHAATPKVIDKRAHYGIDIEQWMRSQHSDTLDDETDHPLESEASEPMSMEEEEVMQNQVASSLQRVHDILQEQEADLKNAHKSQSVVKVGDNAQQESRPTQEEALDEPEHDLHRHAPVEGSLSEESGIFTHESADISRVRPSDTIANMPQSMDSRAGVFVPSLRPSTTALCSKTNATMSDAPPLKSVPPLLTKSTSNLGQLLTQQEGKGEGDSNDLGMQHQGQPQVQHGLDLGGDPGNQKSYPESRLSGTLVGNHSNHQCLGSQGIPSFTELTTSSQA